MNNYDEFFNELISDLKVKKEYDALEPEFQLVREIIKARHTQK